ncbi:MAG: hypothetical protein M1823_000637 [Watsoniomyces obsoletus]|nr:MAG: hypothetical protein M1823_000637 [Watsoniomyces obsoletus]
MFRKAWSSAKDEGVGGNSVVEPIARPDLFGLTGNNDSTYLGLNEDVDESGKGVSTPVADMHPRGPLVQATLFAPVCAQSFRLMYDGKD